MKRSYQGELKIEFNVDIDAVLDDEINKFYLFHEHPENILLEEINALIESKGYILRYSNLTLKSDDNTKIYVVDHLKKLMQDEF